MYCFHPASAVVNLLLSAAFPAAHRLSCIPFLEAVFLPLIHPYCLFRLGHPFQRVFFFCRLRSLYGLCCLCCLPRLCSTAVERCLFLPQAVSGFFIFGGRANAFSVITDTTLPTGNPSSTQSRLCGESTGQTGRTRCASGLSVRRGSSTAPVCGDVFCRSRSAAESFRLLIFNQRALWSNGLLHWLRVPMPFSQETARADAKAVLCAALSNPALGPLAISSVP